MTTWRLFPSTSGPSSPVSYSGNFLAGVVFKVTQGGLWLEGYWKWVAAGGDTVSRKFTLWAVSGAATGTLIPAATVASSGTLTAGQWNFIPLAAPVQLAIGGSYIAATGWTAVSGFEDSDTSGAGTGAGDSFGSGGHTSGIVQGPLTAFSDQGFSLADPFGNPQGVFGVAGTDPAVNMPSTGSNAGNFWMDVQVSDQVPAGYAGTYRLWPTPVAPSASIVADASDNYEVATELALSQACTVSKIWYYSPSAATQLATAANIWNVTGGGLAGTLAASNTSPSWSGAAGSGWISCTLSTVLPAGKYKVGVYNGAASPAACLAKDSQADYWRNGPGGSGIITGPLSAPGLSAASLAYNYDGNPAGTPALSDGTTLAAQSTFMQGPPDAYPYLIALVATPTAGSTQNYWVDLEVTPAPVTATGSISVSGAATAAAPGTAGGSVAVAGTAAAAAPAAAAGSITLAGTAAARASAAAAGSAALAGSATGAAPGAAAGSLVLAATAAATGPGTTGAGALSVTGTAAARAPGAAGGHLAITGTAAAAARGAVPAIGRPVVTGAAHGSSVGQAVISRTTVTRG